MKLLNFKLGTIILFALAILFSSCSSTKRGCDGKKKRKVEMGYM